jgi:CheY-like chemotaxis protein
MSESTARPQTVLVVDDNPTARYSTARGLRAAGFATVETAGGAEALETPHVGAGFAVAVATAV